MGTWGANAFEDDTALEYYDRFCNSQQSISELENGIEIVLSKKYNMEGLLMEGFTEPVKALVFAEIIAKAYGNPSDKFPDDEYHRDMEIRKIEFTSISNKLTEEIKEKTVKTIQKIKVDKNMHLTVLWMESDSYDVWTEYLNGLITRLT